MLAGASNGTGNSLNNTPYPGGNDTASYAFAGAGVTVSLATAATQATGGSGSDALLSIEHLIGSGFNDNLTGSAGNNVLDGGAGSDTIRFNSVLNATTNRDTLTDFSVDDDSIELENAIFTALTTTGALFYDSDGSGGSLAVQFATLSTGLVLTSADFFVT
jgi:Ca2+-binding RTX toxin-like protein